MISTEELVDWIKSCHNNISIHAFDSIYREFLTHSNNCRSDIGLVYYVKDHHLFPITDEKLKLVASKANLAVIIFLKHMSDLKWIRHHENITKLNTIDGILDPKKEFNIVILPESVKMTTAIDKYILKTNFCMEYLHWNNNMFDGFVDHNMYLLNEEYDIRKSICNKLFDRYKTELHLE